MNKDNPGAGRQHRILRALIEHGPLSLPGIRKYVHKPVYADIRVLRKDGHIVDAGMVAAGPASPIKELPSFKATPKGVAYAATDLVPIRRGPGKLSKGADFVIRKAPAGAKSTTKLMPTSDVEVTYTETTKYTTYVPKYEFHVYQPPKQFMECVR